MEHSSIYKYGIHSAIWAHVVTLTMIIIYLVLVEAEQQEGWRMERMLPLPVTPSILTLPALLDDDFPSSILLAALRYL